MSGGRKMTFRCTSDDILGRFARVEPGCPITRPQHIETSAWTGAINRLKQRGFKFKVVRTGQAGGTGSGPRLYYLLAAPVKSVLTTHQPRDLNDLELDLLVDLVVERLTQRAKARKAQEGMSD